MGMQRYLVITFSEILKSMHNTALITTAKITSHAMDHGAYKEVKSGVSFNRTEQIYILLFLWLYQGSFP